MDFLTLPNQTIRGPLAVASFIFLCNTDALPGAINQGATGVDFSAGSVASNCPGGGLWMAASDVNTGVFQAINIADGMLITSAILGTWGVGYAARMIIRVVRR